jgi:hypothetical protein
MKKDNIVIVLDAQEILKKFTAKYGKHPKVSSTYESAKRTFEALNSQIIK